MHGILHVRSVWSVVMPCILQVEQVMEGILQLEQVMQGILPEGQVRHMYRVCDAKLKLFGIELSKICRISSNVPVFENPPKMLQYITPPYYS